MRGIVRRIGGALTQVGLVGLVLLVWEGAARVRILDPILFSRPSEIARGGWLLLSGTAFYADVGLTLFEILVSFAIATAAGVLGGLLIGEVDLLFRAFHRPILMLYSLPTVVLFPLFLLFFGVGIEQKIAFGATFGLFPVLVNTITGIRSTSGVLLTVGRILGGTRSEIWRKVVLPSAVPLLATGLRISMVYTIIGVVIAEMFVSRRGIGLYVTEATRNLQMDQFFFVVGVISGISLALTETLRYLELRVSHWRVE